MQLRGAGPSETRSLRVRWRVWDGKMGPSTEPPGEAALRESTVWRGVLGPLPGKRTATMGLVVMVLGRRTIGCEDTVLTSATVDDDEVARARSPHAV